MGKIVVAAAFDLIIRVNAPNRVDEEFVVPAAPQVGDHRLGPIVSGKNRCPGQLRRISLPAGLVF